jgi:hypothetical protein
VTLETLQLISGATMSKKSSRVLQDSRRRLTWWSMKRLN